MIHGEDVGLVARSFGVSAADVSRWREKVIETSLYSLQSRARDARDVEIARLHAKVGEITMVNELLDEKIERMESGRPFGRRRSKR